MEPAFEDGIVNERTTANAFRVDILLPGLREMVGCEYFGKTPIEAILNVCFGSTVTPCQLRQAPAVVMPAVSEPEEMSAVPIEKHHGRPHLRADHHRHF